MRRLGKRTNGLCPLASESIPPLRSDVPAPRRFAGDWRVLAAALAGWTRPGDGALALRAAVRQPAAEVRPAIRPVPDAPGGSPARPAGRRALADRVGCLTVAHPGCPSFSAPSLSFSASGSLCLVSASFAAARLYSSAAPVEGRLPQRGPSGSSAYPPARATVRPFRPAQ